MQLFPDTCSFSATDLDTGVGVNRIWHVTNRIGYDWSMLETDRLLDVSFQ